jgi:hypothetical protein
MGKKRGGQLLRAATVLKVKNKTAIKGKTSSS